MGSESKHKNGHGVGGRGAAQGIPATAKKVVQSLKEIVNCTDCTEQEIYAILKECDMDPNRAVERLLAQDTFHEVKSKRERRKEMKEALDSRSRGNNVGLSCGIKAGCECNVVQSGSTHVTHNELGKAADKGEVGSVCPSLTSSTTHVIGENNNSDSFSTDDGRQSLGTGDSISASAQVSRGLQPAWLGVNKGHLSMADIVKMGRPSQDAVLHHHPKASDSFAKSESSLSLHSPNHSGQEVFNDQWSVIEQPMVSNASHALNTSNANVPSNHSNSHAITVSMFGNCESDVAATVSQGDVISDGVTFDKIESATMSSTHTIMKNAELASHSKFNLKNTGSSDSHSYLELHEGSSSQQSFLNYSDTSVAVVDVSSTASSFQRMSIRDSKPEVPSIEDNNRAVVFPNHLEALAAECSHLSFGTYNGASNSASSAILESNLSRSGMKEKAASVDSPSVHHSDTSNSVYYGDKQLGFDIFKETASDKNYEFLSTQQQELLKHIVPEVTFGHEYTMSSVPGPGYQKSQWVTPLLPFKRPDLQSGNLSTFPREMHANTNLIPDDLLAFPMKQLQHARYSNAVSSISSPAISMPEVMKPIAFAVPHRSALPQDCTVQTSLRTEQLADIRGYHSQPQNRRHMSSINSQQALSGSTVYDQFLADMKYSLPQSRNEIFASRLSYARDAFGYGNLGSSSFNSGSFLPISSLGPMMPLSKFDEILPSQYNVGRNLSSLQQHGRFSTRDFGDESRSLSLPDSTRHSFLGQPSQTSSQYITSGNSDLYHSQAGVMAELQRQGGSLDLSSQQLHQFWQHSH